MLIFQKRSFKKINQHISINQSFISSIITMTLIKEFFLMMKIKVLLQYFESLRDVVSDVCGSRRIAWHS